MLKSYIYNILSYGLMDKKTTLVIINSPKELFATLNNLCYEYNLWRWVYFADEVDNKWYYTFRGEKVCGNFENALKVYWTEDLEVYPNSITFDELRNRCENFTLENSLQDIIKHFEGCSDRFAETLKMSIL